MSAFPLLEVGSIVTIESIEISSPLISSISLSGAGALGLLVLALLAILMLYARGYLDFSGLGDFISFSA